MNATITAADNSGATPAVALVSVTSNEPDDAPGGADGNTTNDIVIVDQDTPAPSRAQRQRHRPHLHNHLSGDGRLREHDHRVNHGHCSAQIMN